jgi:anti-sigma B factor antagonist
VGVSGRISARDGDEPRVELVGEFDMADAPQLTATVAEVGAGRGEIAIDMRGVTFMDSSGLHALVDATRIDQGPTTLVLLDPPARVVRTMEIVGIVRMAEVEIRSRVDG